MANPRKFSEKIALHNQKQAEETAAFEQIMREVSDATAKPEDNVLSHLGLGSASAINNLEGIKTNALQRESRGRSVGGGPIRSRPIERKMDTSPYSSGPYLSPPPDTSWRRTNSDSALHHSAMQGHGGDCNSLQRRQPDSRWNLSQKDTRETYEQRPRSSCDVPRVPGINIYPSVHEPGTIQIPINNNNTGSLPDLTNVHFPSPLNTPLDNEAEHSSSPYSSSPISASPATLSPTSLPTRQPTARFQFSPTTQRAASPLTSQNHLSVPVNSRYLHHNKVSIDDQNFRQAMLNGFGLDNSNITTLVDPADFSQQFTLSNMYQQQCSPPSPTPSHHNSQQISTGYRSPQTRPSPQSSPGLTPEGGRHSAPCSPAAPHSPLPAESYFLTQAALLQHNFEQFSMVDTPVTNYNLETNSTNVQYTQATNDISNLVGNELVNDAGYFSTSPGLAYPTGPTSLHTTPTTPTSIPDLIITDFSNAGDDLCRQELAKELGTAITGSLNSDLYPLDDSIRQDLGPIDFGDLQMLTDPDMHLLSDNKVEDNFRLDRL